MVGGFKSEESLGASEEAMCNKGEMMRTDMKQWNRGDTKSRYILGGY